MVHNVTGDQKCVLVLNHSVLSLHTMNTQTTFKIIRLVFKLHFADKLNRLPPTMTERYIYNDMWLLKNCDQAYFFYLMLVMVGIVIVLLFLFYVVSLMDVLNDTFSALVRNCIESNIKECYLSQSASSFPYNYSFTHVFLCLYTLCLYLTPYTIIGRLNYI